MGLTIPKNKDTSQHKSVVFIGLGENVPIFLAASWHESACRWQRDP